MAETHRAGFRMRCVNTLTGFKWISSKLDDV